MAFYRKKPVVIEAFTFDEFVAAGKKWREEAGQPVTEANGMPWSFEFRGHQVTHENDCCYLIPTREGVMNMTPNDMLLVGVEGEIYPCKVDIFQKSYEDA